MLGWWQARWSPGVVRIVLAGGRPAVVPDGIITELRQRERGGVVQLPEAPGLCAGDRVKILRGPLQGHLGLYQGMKPRERVDILLQLLGGACRVTLPRGSVERVPDAGGL